jgi:hypothetical protein
MRIRIFHAFLLSVLFLVGSVPLPIRSEKRAFRRRRGKLVASVFAAEKEVTCGFGLLPLLIVSSPVL